MTAVKDKLIVYSSCCGFVAVFGLLFVLLGVGIPAIKTIGLAIAFIGFASCMGFLGAYTKFTWFYIPQFRKMIDVELDYRRKYCDYKL